MRATGNQRGRAAVVALWRLSFALLLSWAAVAWGADAPEVLLPDDALAAVNDFLLEAGSPLAGRALATVEAVADETLLVRLVAQDAEPLWGFLRFADGHWTVLGIGGSFGADFYEAQAIPDSLQVYGAYGSGPAGVGPGMGTRYVPVAAEVCEGWAAVLEEELGLPAERLEAPFRELLGGEGRACRLVVEGTGSDLEAFPVVAADLIGRLEREGWQEDPRYAADGPTGTAVGLRREGALALLQVGWEPAEGLSCPEDEPIFDCEVAAEDQRYTVLLELAQELAGGEAEMTNGMTNETSDGAETLPAVQRAAERLAERLGVPRGAISLVSADYVEWPDACLGLAPAGQMCAQVITPGYRITLEAGGASYVYHSDESGRLLQPAGPTLEGARQEELP